MHAPRFWLDEALGEGREVSLPQRIVHHAVNVLRLRNGAPIILFNGRGGEARAILNARTYTAMVEHVDAVDRESPLFITLVQAWLVNVKLDWVVEKFVELGASRLIIVPASRCVAKLSGDRLRSRIDHLREVIVSACCQSGRTSIPSVHAAGTMEQGLTTAAADSRALLLVPGATQSLVAAAADSPRITIAVGPEGGFDDSEMALATQLGYRPAHMGPRILRTETAGLAAIAQLQAQYGDLV